ncbi:MAG: hypothetical protein HGA85_08625, partial [Nanoarchaeota archaeon]|nr:hypothetical protein [Nanoarchaeota archaeon]
QSFRIIYGKPLWRQPVLRSGTEDDTLWITNLDLNTMVFDPNTPFNERIFSGYDSKFLKVKILNGSLAVIPIQDWWGHDTIRLKITNPGNFSKIGYLPIQVIPVNDPPHFTSIPVQSAVSGEVYAYSMHAEDQDSLSLIYSLIYGPAGMQIEGNSLSYTAAMGNHTIIVRVSDGDAYDEQTFVLYVSERLNHDPVITSSPGLSVTQDSLYQYSIIAADIDSDPLDYRVEGPSGMSLIGSQVIWAPNSTQVGVFPVYIEVDDSRGGVAAQYFNLTVIDVDDPPVITSTPPGTAYLWQIYKYQVKAFDPEGKPLRYSLEDQPKYMFINKKTGTVYFVPTSDGQVKARVAVSDGHLVTKQPIVINVYSRSGQRVHISSSGSLDVTGLGEIVLDENGRGVLIGEISDSLANGKIPISTILYKYLSLKDQGLLEEGESNVSGHIIYRVERAWLNQVDADIGDVELYRLDSKTYLPSVLAGEDLKYFYMDAYFTDLGDFAILAKIPEAKLKSALENASRVTRLKRPVVITGQISYSDIAPASHIYYKIINLRSNQSWSGSVDNPSSIYSEVIEGKVGDELQINVRGDGFEESKMARITGDVTKSNLKLSITLHDAELLSKKEETKRILINISLIVLMLSPLALIITGLWKKR